MENLPLSPRKNTSLYIEKASRKREYQKDFKSSVAFKRRRRELKSTASKEVIYCIAVLMIFMSSCSTGYLSSFISYLLQYYFVGVNFRDKRGGDLWACYRFVPCNHASQVMRNIFLSRAYRFRYIQVYFQLYYRFSAHWTC